MKKLIWVPGFFALRVVAALCLFKLSASFLPVSGFAVFSQLMLFAALLNVLALCGAENGVIRQAAAARDVEDLMRTQSAAFAIWSTTVPLVLLPMLVGGGLVSKILIGSPTAWPMVLAIAATALLSAPGGIWCALLTGRKRVAQSLSAQAAGLVSGAGAAAWRITAHDPAGAVLAFAGGSLVTCCLALPWALQLGLPFIPRPSRWPWVRTLLRYSAAIAATTGYASIVAFGLRWIYREHFGVTQLGYWLAASRISDLSTQLVGLFLIQVFVPQLATTLDSGHRRAFLVRSWLVTAGVTTCILLVFSFASRLLIHLFLSDAYLPAAAMIRTYMVGDILRVWPSLAMHTAFANGRPLRYAGIEMGTLTVMAAVSVALTLLGDVAALQTGYLVAYAIAATCVSAAFLLRARPTPAPSGANPSAKPL
ncbi:oligosaccharide flippase family protein [Caulobacter sp. S45]|uniref:oligosaccharide flippase family protein n=1 Tax=Caulobacter sp. S45 TaxID=1641861 RepID=UPI00131D73AF|nr:oligosaccharide flippase family protein [Caulobacter sp. S45]